MVGVHVGQLDVYQQQHLTRDKAHSSSIWSTVKSRRIPHNYLVLSAAFSVPDMLGDDSLHLLPQHGILSQL